LFETCHKRASYYRRSHLFYFLIYEEDIFDVLRATGERGPYTLLIPTGSFSGRERERERERSFQH
jgi:hypothetical protein